MKYIIIGYKKYKCLHPPNLEVFNSETIKKVKTKQKKRYKRTWNLSVYNLYNRQNPFFVYLAQNDNNENVARQVSLFPIIPTITYSIKF